MSNSAAPTHPILRYHGGKWRLAPWVISHFPAHDVYVEPFAGAASVLLRKPPSRVEVINDAYSRVVNLFRVLRDPIKSLRLAQLCDLTPYAEEEYLEAREPAADPVEDARRMLILGGMGHGSPAPAGGRLSGWRRRITEERWNNPARQWANVGVDVLAAADRLRGVYIEHRDYAAVMAQWDAPGTLFYCDPPYLTSTRQASARYGSYAHEMGDDEHEAMLDRLLAIKGKVLLSGYPSELYDDRLKGWRKATKAVLADKSSPRTEVLWMNFDPPARLNFGEQP